MEWAPLSGIRGIMRSQEEAESTAGAHFTQSDSGGVLGVEDALSGLAVIDPSPARDRTMRPFQFPHSFSPC